MKSAKYYHTGTTASMLELLQQFKPEKSEVEGERTFEITVTDLTGPVADDTPVEDEHKPEKFAEEKVSPAEKAAADLNKKSAEAKTTAADAKTPSDQPVMNKVPSNTDESRTAGPTSKKG